MPQDDAAAVAECTGVKHEGGRRGPLPIVVGIAGHRDMHIADEDRLREAVRTKLEALLADYPHTPVLVLSPLAIGADRLAAAVALEISDVEVVVPMPFETDEYEKDFDKVDPSHEQRDAFRALLAKARCSYSVGRVPPAAAPPAPETEPEKDAARDGQYAQVGAYIARNSQMLIALWDAIPTSKIGGTAQIVEFKLTGYAQEFGPKPAPLDVPESSPVYHVPTRRNADDELPEHCREPKIVWPRADASSTPSGHRKVHDKTLDRIERFNVDALKCRGRKHVDISTDSIDEAAKMLADRYRDRTHATLNVLYLGAAVAALSFVLYAHAYQHHWPVLGVDFLATLAAVVIYFLAHRGQVQSRYQDYRALVEGLRVQSFWHRANLRETVADHYMRQHRSELDWIRNAIRVCRVLDDTARASTVTSEIKRRCIVENVRDEWIERQITYLRHRRNVERTMFQICRAVAQLMLSVSVILIAVTLVGASGVAPRIAALLGEPEQTTWNSLIVAISVAAVLSGLAESFADKRAFRVHVKQYRRMQAHFTRARALLDGLLAKRAFDADAFAEAQSVIRDLGVESLAENGAWVMLHREHPVEFVHGG